MLLSLLPRLLFSLPLCWFLPPSEVAGSIYGSPEMSDPRLPSAFSPANHVTLEPARLPLVTDHSLKSCSPSHSAAPTFFFRRYLSCYCHPLDFLVIENPSPLFPPWVLHEVELPHDLDYPLLLVSLRNRVSASFYCLSLLLPFFSTCINSNRGRLRPSHFYLSSLLLKHA